MPGVDGNCLGTYDGCEPLLKYIQSAVTGDFADDIAALRTRNAGTSIPSPGMSNPDHYVFVAVLCVL